MKAAFVYNDFPMLISPMLMLIELKHSNPFIHRRQNELWLM